MKAVDFISEILNQCEDGDYIFRGTNEQFSEKKEGNGINSLLYRWWAIEEQDIFNDKFHPQNIEKETVEKAKKHFPDQTSNIEILTELQHYGGKTNCIDFSRNLYIALFFACNGNFEKDGELILLDKNKYSIIKEIKYDQKSESIELIEPAITHSSKQRVHFQSSVFVRALGGYLKKDDLKILSIRKDQKQTILTYLEKIHNIKQDTIYNDIFGFIENEKNYQTAAVYFFKGFANIKKGEYGKAIKNFTQAIKLKPNMASAYINRGITYGHTKKYDDAIEDFTQAIKLDTNMVAIVYFNRGFAYQCMDKHDEAIKDFTQAINLDTKMADVYVNRNPNMIADAYYNRGNSYSKLDKKKLAEEDNKKALELKSKLSN